MSDDLDPSRRDAVAGLIARVGTIGRELVDLKADFEQLRMGGDVGELRNQVEALAAIVRSLADEEAAETEGERATWWPDMEAGEERASALRALGSWVDEVIRGRHPEAYKDLQPCWYWHADIVDELTALRAAWFAAYRDSESSVTAAIEWHDRWLPGAMTRCKAAMKARACKGGHQPAAKTKPFYDDGDFERFTSDPAEPVVSN